MLSFVGEPSAFSAALPGTSAHRSAEMSPAPSERIPVLVGGISDRALRRAALVGDGWISDLHTADELASYIERIRAIRADSPRAGEPLQIIGACSDAFDVDGCCLREDGEDGGLGEDGRPSPWRLRRRGGVI